MSERDECVTCGVTIGGEHDCATATPYAAARSARIRELEAIAAAFLAKYDELRPAMDGAFAMQANHGVPYSGPTWEQEINDLRAALSTKEQDYCPTCGSYDRHFAANSSSLTDPPCSNPWHGREPSDG